MQASNSMHVLSGSNGPHTPTVPLARNLIPPSLGQPELGQSSGTTPSSLPNLQHLGRTRDGWAGITSMCPIICVPVQRQRRSLPPTRIMPARLWPSIGQRFPVSLATANRVPIAEKHSYLGSWPEKRRFAPCLNLSVPRQSLVDRCWQA